MFVLFMLVVVCFIGLISAASSIRHENMSKKISREIGSDIYVDRTGRTRRMSDHKLTFTTHNDRGDLVEMNPRTGEIYRNISAERRDEYTDSVQAVKEKAIANGKEFYIYDPNVSNNPKFGHYQVPYITDKGELTRVRPTIYGDDDVYGAVWRATRHNYGYYVARWIDVVGYQTEKYLPLTDDEIQNHSHGRRETALIMLCLSDGLFKVDTIRFFKREKNSAKWEQVSSLCEWSMKRIYNLIDWFNAKDREGRFIHRNNKIYDDKWFNQMYKSANYPHCDYHTLVEGYPDQMMEETI